MEMYLLIKKLSEPSFRRRIVVYTCMRDTTTKQELYLALRYNCSVFIFSLIFPPFLKSTKWWEKLFNASIQFWFIVFILQLRCPCSNIKAIRAQRTFSISYCCKQSLKQLLSHPSIHPSKQKYGFCYPSCWSTFLP